MGVAKGLGRRCARTHDTDNGPMDSAVGPKRRGKLIGAKVYPTGQRELVVERRLAHVNAYLH